MCKYDSTKDWYENADDINRLAEDINQKENVLAESELGKKIARGVGSAMLAGSLAANQVASADIGKGKDIHVTREVSGKPVRQLAEVSKSIHDDAPGEIRKKPYVKARSAVVSQDISKPTTVIPMARIGDKSSQWGTEAGKTLIDSIVNEYARYGMSATFDRIRVNLYIVSPEVIKKVCKDPITGESYNTEYGCTVNAAESLASVTGTIEEKYADVRTHSMPGTIIPSFDWPSLAFNVYLSTELSINQRAELLVHELKHCMCIYAYVQKVVSMYARDASIDHIGKYLDTMRDDLSTYSTEINRILDEADQFIPDEPFSSSVDIVSKVLSYEVFKPYQK